MRQVHWLDLVLVIALAAASGAAAQSPAEAPGLPHELIGIVKSIDASGSQLTLETRIGRLIQIDATAALQMHHMSVPSVGHAVKVQGTYDAKGVLRAALIQRAKESKAGWSADR